MEQGAPETTRSSQNYPTPNGRRMSVEGWIVALLLVMSMAVWFFLEIADEVSDNDTQQFDERFLLALRNPADLQDPVGPWWLEIAAGDITALGGGRRA